MDRWEYKAVSTDALIKRSQDHDIDVYKEEVSLRRESARKDMEKALNLLGLEGWDLVALMGEFAIFKRKL